MEPNSGSIVDMICGISSTIVGREASLPECFRHLKADEAPSRDQRGARLLRVDIGFDPIDIGNGPELEDIGRVGSRQGRHDGVAALGEDELIVGKPGLACGSLHFDPLPGPVDLDRLRVDEDLHSIARVEAPPESGGGASSASR